ncbi:helix-turn-helix domain-containing protein [Nostoc sp. CHAB 5834]|nr:helix-turn-helix domain-containing protein [Nostoc sp. CHAB 5834]
MTASERDAQTQKVESSAEVTLPLPFIPAWLDDYGLNPPEFRVYAHIARRAGKTGKCWESVVNIAKACRLCRNLTLKALQSLTEKYRFLIRNKREGETYEYSLAPQSEWAPPVPPEDRCLSRAKREKAPTDPSLQGTGSDTLEEHQPVVGEDTKVIQFKGYQERQQQDNVVVPIDFDKLSIWRRNQDATRYCQIPPIYDEATGVEVQQQMDTEGITAQKVVSRAIALSKVPRLILEMMASAGEKLVVAYKSLEKGLQKRNNQKQTQITDTAKPSSVPETNGIPEHEFQRLKEQGIYLNLAVADELWLKYSSDFADAIAYVLSKDKVKDKAAYLRKCLEQGWLKDSKSQRRDPYDLNEEQKQWYEWASSCGLCDGRPIRYCCLMNGEVAIVVFEPELKCHTPMPLSRAMQKYPYLQLEGV